ncbi:MAG TPA: (2Fe-2S) ferredoxin domain-containing protein [Myxococcales bacterium]|jgi:(2Fe-2S) ferredoxin|nr:(2Fe-2S) ferredoxin domain-containing protein [Myxococcales bacterium]
MPPPFKKHLFVCINDRGPDHPRGSCAQKGSESLLKAFKRALNERGLGESIRTNRAGCLDNCELGCSVVVYPEGVWYGRVTEADVPEIIEEHLMRDRPVDRLRLYAPPEGAPQTAAPDPKPER